MYTLFAYKTSCERTDHLTHKKSNFNTPQVDKRSTKSNNCTSPLSFLWPVSIKPNTLKTVSNLQFICSLQKTSPRHKYPKKTTILSSIHQSSPFAFQLLLVSHSKNPFYKWMQHSQSVEFSIDFSPSLLRKFASLLAKLRIFVATVPSLSFKLKNIIFFHFSCFFSKTLSFVLT